MKKKIDQEGLEKGEIDVKNEWKVNRLSLMGRYNWFHHTEMINLKLDVSFGSKQLFRYVFPEKYSSWFVIPF